MCLRWLPSWKSAGLGTAALWLAKQGHHVVACDIAPGAVRIVQERARRSGLAIELRIADVLADTTSLPLSDVVLDRGVLHTFVAQEGRVAFAAAVACLLQPGGLWLDVSGSAETPGDPAEAAARRSRPLLHQRSGIPASAVHCAAVPGSTRQGTSI